MLPAFGLAFLMAITFGVTTEAIRRGPLGAVSPITALSPALTAILGMAALGERLAPWGYAGVALAPLGVALLSLDQPQRSGHQGWARLAVFSLVLQGIGAFIAKLVVTPAGPSALLLTSASVQVVVGLFLAPPHAWNAEDLRGRPATYTAIAYAVAAVVTIAHLLAIAAGPAAVIMPMVATSPALAGILGIAFMHERASGREYAGIVLAMAGGVLLSTA